MKRSASAGRRGKAATFKMSPPQKTPQKTPQKPTELEQKILNVIREKPTISRAEIAKKLKVSENTIKEYLEKLKSKSFLKRIGPDKGGYWEILGEQEIK